MARWLDSLEGADPQRAIGMSEATRTTTGHREKIKAALDGR